MATFGKKLFDARKSLGITQGELAVRANQVAKRISLNKARISRMEAGKSPVPLNALGALCVALQTKPNQFLGYETDKRMVDASTSLAEAEAGLAQANNKLVALEKITGKDINRANDVGTLNMACHPNIGDRVRYARGLAKLSQAKLSKMAMLLHRANISEDKLSRLENSDANVSLVDFVIISGLLCTTPNYLLNVGLYSQLDQITYKVMLTRGKLNHCVALVKKIEALLD